MDNRYLRCYAPSPGNTATLILNVFTDINPRGHQGLTSPRCHTLNSGCVVKWLDDKGKQGSAVTPSIVVGII